VAELELKVGDERILVRVELVLTGDHRSDEFFNLWNGRARKRSEFSFGLLNLGGAFDGGVPDEDGDVHGTLGGGAVIAGLFKNRLTEGRELIGDGESAWRFFDGVGLRGGEVPFDGAGLAIAEGTAGLTTGVGRGHGRGSLAKPISRRGQAHSL
jgi:hypothetical protein